MRYVGVVLFLAGAACSSKGRATPDAGVAIGPPKAPPAPSGAKIVHCKSADGKYRVDLDFTGSDSQPSTARVFAEGRDEGAANATGVAHGSGFPPPGALTCNKSDDPTHTGCFVASTSDYGYIASVTFKQGKRTVELRQNGVASTHLAALDCD